MANSPEEWSKRVDRADALHESALEQVADTYRLCKTVETQEKELQTLCESLATKTDPESFAKKVKAEALLVGLQTHKQSVEAQFQKSVKYAQEVGGFKLLVEQLATSVYERSVSTMCHSLDPM